LFSFDFFLICSVNVTKKKKRKEKKKKKKEKYSEKEMCDLYFVYECFFFLYDKIARIKKNLIF
jgi:hypothetical protein